MSADCNPQEEQEQSASVAYMMWLIILMMIKAFVYSVVPKKQRSMMAVNLLRMNRYLTKCYLNAGIMWHS